MAAPKTPTPKDDEYYDRTQQTSRGLSADEQTAGQSAAKDQRDAFENEYGDKNDKRDTPTSGSDDLKQREADDGDQWKTNVSGKGSKKTGRIKTMAKNKKWLASAGVVGIIGSLLAVFAALLPLKLEMLVQNITQQAAAVPGYAIEQRTEYLVTRALATRLMVASGADIGDGHLVFCGKGGIACHLYRTWKNDYFEKKLGLKITAEVGGRARLGAPGKNWENIVVKNGDTITEVVKNIDNHKEARRFIKKQVRLKTRPTQVITRYLVVKTLRQKFGIKRFSGPKKLEKTKKGLAAAKTKLKSNIIRGTVGRITPRLSTYLSCLQGKDVALCQENLKQLKSTPNVKDPGSRAEFKEAHPDGNYNKELSKYKHSEASKKLVSSTGSPGKDPGKKFISKQVVKLVGGGVAGVGMLDLMFRAINGIDDGALESVWYDMASQTYVNFAIDNVVIPNEKLKAGDLDIDTYGAATSLFDGGDSSPLMQYENGVMKSPPGESGRVTTECDTDDGVEDVTLAKGELICPDEKTVRDYSSELTANGSWHVLAQTANAWVEGPGVLIKAFYDTLGGIISQVPGFKEVAKLAGKAIEPIITWIIGLVFDPPDVGLDSSGNKNYTGLSSGIRVTENQTMLEGVDEDGELSGAGGRVLSDAEISAITSEQTEADQTFIASQSNLPAFLNPRITGSLTQRMLFNMPTNMSSLFAFPGKTLQAAMNVGPTVSAANGGFNPSPTGIPIYGYADSDGVFNANPETYTESSCEASSKRRADSLDRYKGISPIPIYRYSDPCALEKTVVGAQLTANNVDDKYALKDPIKEFTTDSDSSSGNTTSGDIGFPVDAKYWKSNRRFFTKPHRGGGAFTGGASADIPLRAGTTVYAMAGGKVSKETLSGGLNAGLEITSKIDGGTLKIAYAHGPRSSRSKVSYSAGDKIMSIGAIGPKVTGPHLHVDMTFNGKAVCPQDVFIAIGNNKKPNFSNLIKKARSGCGR